MTLISDLAATNDIAMMVAGAIERALGDDVILAVGLPREEPPTPDVLPTGQLRAVRVPFDEGLAGSLVVFVGEQLARALEATAADQSLMTALGTAVSAGADEVVRTAGEQASAGAPVEINASELLSHPLDGEFLVYPLLEGADRVACLVVNVGSGEVGGAIGDIMPPTSVAVHEFPPLQGGNFGHADPRPLSLLSDVEMGVTAELGRRRMTVRELLGLTPGSVIELDRAAGTPVDVLVNGTLIARGEVVVIDEEFGIRVSEIVSTEAG